jgi:hypothetical protein
LIADLEKGLVVLSGSDTAEDLTRLKIGRG